MRFFVADSLTDFTLFAYPAQHDNVPWLTCDAKVFAQMSSIVFQSFRKLQTRVFFIRKSIESITKPTLHKTEYNPFRDIALSFSRVPSNMPCSVFWSSSFAFCLIRRANVSKFFASQLFSYTLRSSRDQMVSIGRAWGTLGGLSWRETNGTFSSCSSLLIIAIHFRCSSAFSNEDRCSSSKTAWNCWLMNTKSSCNFPLTDTTSIVHGSNDTA